MNSSFINFISFARGIQNGFNTNNYPLLDGDKAEKEYSEAFSRFSFSYDVEKDILTQYKNGEIDSWDAIEQLEDECNLSYDEAYKKVRLLSSVSVCSGKREFPFIEDTNAYWINPAGKTLSVGLSHVDTICDFPECFGFTDTYVQALYKEYSEPYRSEGEARGVLMLEALKKGWICIRRFTRTDTYHIDLYRLDERHHKDYLLDWAGALVKANPDRASSVVIIRDVSDNSSLDGTIEDLVSFKLFSSVGVGFFRITPIFNGFDFLNLQPNVDFINSIKKRKRSKYHGSLVNNTFDDVLGGVPTTPLASPALASFNIQTHPSIRYLVVNHMMHHSRKYLVRSSLSGTLDTFLLQNYCAGLGTDDPGNKIQHTGANGRVVLSFTSDSGSSTNVDLGGSLSTGYVVAQIEDGLGLFPEGTVVGDLLDNAVVQEIVRSQGERDRASIMSSASPIFSMARGLEQTVPRYIFDRFMFAGYDGWIGELQNVQDGNVFARYINGGDDNNPSVNVTFFFVFVRDVQHKSSGEAPSGEAFKFRALYVKYGNKRFGGKFSDGSFAEVEKSVFKKWLGAIKELQLEEVSVVDPLVYAKSSLHLSLSQPIFSMARGLEQTVPDYVINRFSAFAYDGWIGENKNVQNGSAFARYLDGGDDANHDINVRFFFVFVRDSQHNSMEETPMAEAFKFKALYVEYGDERFGRKFQDSDFKAVEKTVIKQWLGAIKSLSLEKITGMDPLVYAKSSLQSSYSSAVFSDASSVSNLGTDVVKAFSDFAAGVREFDRVFSQYVQYLQGNVFEAFDRNSTRDPIRAKECLKDLSQCIFRVTNDCVRLRKCLSLGRRYSDDEVKEINSNIVDIVGTWVQVRGRFDNLSNPDRTLIDMCSTFQKTLQEFGSSVDEYDASGFGSLLCTISQAKEINAVRSRSL